MLLPIFKIKIYENTSKIWKKVTNICQCSKYVKRLRDEKTCVVLREKQNQYLFCDMLVIVHWYCFFTRSTTRVISRRNFAHSKKTRICFLSFLILKTGMSIWAQSSEVKRDFRYTNIFRTRLGSARAPVCTTGCPPVRTESFPKRKVRSPLPKMESSVPHIFWHGAQARSVRD